MSDAVTVNGVSARDSLRERLRKAGIPSGVDVGGEAWEDAELPLAKLRFNPSYQRNVRQGDVKRIAEEFMSILFEPPLVNWRDSGEFYCMDGQHRVLAMLERFGDQAQATCRLFYELTIEQEAMIFHSQTNRRPLTPLEEFRGHLASGTEPAVTINAICESTGWTVARYFDDNRSSGGIMAVSALRTVFNHNRDGHLALTLTVLRECFGTEFAPTSSLILGFAQFLTWYEDEYEMRHLVRRMREVGLTGMRVEADKRRLLDRVTSREAVGMAVVMFYNLRRKREHRLMAWETVVRTRKGGAQTHRDSVDGGGR